MYLVFINIGRYDIKARRHLACVQNGITQLGDWRMETWQLALRARCHVSIRQSPSLCNAILNTCPCLLAILYITHLLPRGYFYTKNDMIVVNIVIVIGRKWIWLQKHRQMNKLKPIYYHLHKALSTQFSGHQSKMSEWHIQLPWNNEIKQTH